MGKLTKQDEAYNACVVAANEYLGIVTDTLDKYNAVAKALYILHPTSLFPPCTLVRGKHAKTDKG